jgi:hypothetical protein
VTTGVKLHPLLVDRFRPCPKVDLEAPLEDRLRSYIPTIYWAAFFWCQFAGVAGHF